MKNIFKIKWLALFGLAFLFGCTPDKPDVLTLELSGKTMGTTFSVKVVSDNELPDAKQVLADINATLIEVNRQMSTYQGDSELSQFNQHESTSTFPVNRDLAFVVDEAIRIGRLSEGAFDVTIGPLVNLWGFGPDGRPNRVPSNVDISNARQRMGQKELIVTDEGLVKLKPELYVDLSALAKGFGVDKVAQLLESKGLQNYMVEIGGELRLKGKNASGVNWRIVIEKPSEFGHENQRLISPGDMAIATSGDYRNYFEVDGVRYAHIIDPVTARPVTHKLASVTVLHPSSMTADGFATALSVMGPEKAMILAKQQELAVMLVVYTDAGFVEKHSPEFDKMLDNMKK